MDYNATLLFENGEIIERYRKIHLVPFTEYFPYRNVLTGVYEWRRDADTHFWEKGKDYTVFEAGGVKFSTPICFEDTFGYLVRQFVREGAEVPVYTAKTTLYSRWGDWFAIVDLVLVLLILSGGVVGRLIRTALRSL